MTAADLVVRYGGSLSGEHGDGQARAELLPKMYGDELVHAFGEFKAIWDPEGRMNPGKVVDPYPITEQPAPAAKTTHAGAAATHFHYPRRRRWLRARHAALRRRGQVPRRDRPGRCARATWCTREEKHTTRGRAQLLLRDARGRGDRATAGSSEEVARRSTCASACKGCKGDCPVNVDMATYKAEFMSHYYAGRCGRAAPTPSA